MAHIRSHTGSSLELIAVDNEDPAGASVANSNVAKLVYGPKRPFLGSCANMEVDKFLLMAIHDFWFGLV